MDLSDIRLNCGLELEEYYVKSDKYNQLADAFVRISKENAELRKENASLIKAVDNLDSANKKISNELSGTRWELIKAQEQIKKLTELDVDVEVSRR